MRTPQEIEGRIRKRVEEIPELTWGYIGNFESWGDDRKLFIWVKGIPPRPGQNTIDIWSAEAKTLSATEASFAFAAIKGFETALKLLRP
jgi:hypothetical protein